MLARSTFRRATIAALALGALVSGLQAQEGQWQSASYRRLPPPAIKAVDAVGAWFLPRPVKGYYKDQADLMVAQIREGRIAPAEATWARFCSYYFEGGSLRDLDAIVNWVMREGCLVPNPQEKYWMDKVRYYNQLEREVSAYLQRLEALAAFPYNPDREIRVPVLKVSWTFREDEKPVLLRRSTHLTYQELQDSIAAWRGGRARARELAEEAAQEFGRRVGRDEVLLKQVTELSGRMYAAALAAAGKRA